MAMTAYFEEGNSSIISGYKEEDKKPWKDGRVLFLSSSNFRRREVCLV